jgi:TPR repeat protein
MPMQHGASVALFLSLLVPACGGGNAASRLVDAPAYQPKDQTKCGVERSQAHPLIVEWPSPDRLQLENKVSQGIAVVHYVGCEMTVLERCAVPSKYVYLGATRNEDKVEMKDEDDLYANLPVGAAKLEGKLRRSGRLTVNMNLVGRYEAQKNTVSPDELQGECAGATHFVYGVTVGAFDFYAGGDAAVGASAGIGSAGAGASSQAARETLTKAGDVSSCVKATTADKSPPEGCGALIRLEVVPITQVGAPPAAAGSSGATPSDAARSAPATAMARMRAAQDARLAAIRGPAGGPEADRTKCQQGDGEACYFYGLALVTGKWRALTDFAPEPSAAGFYFKKSCENHSAPGCMELASALLRGADGLPVDRSQAMTIYTSACDSTPPKEKQAACMLLATFYESGMYGVKVDKKRAAALYDGQCKAGDAGACTHRDALTH